MFFGLQIQDGKILGKDLPIANFVATRQTKNSKFPNFGVYS